MPELIHKTVGKILEENAERYPQNDAAVYVDRNIRYSWRQLNAICDRAAKGFMALGAKSGDKIAVWGTNRPEWLITQFAAAKIGAALVTVNPEWKADELEYCLKQSEAKIIVMQEGFSKESGGEIFNYDYAGILKSVAPEMENCRPEELRLEKLPELKNAILVSGEPQPGMILWNEFLEKSAGTGDEDYELRKSSVTPYFVLIIQYTSGTTGFPKGAMLTHYGVVNNALSCAENLGLTPADRICGPVPYYHIFGSATLNVCALVSGAAAVIPAEHFNARKTLEAVEKEKCAAIYGVPTMFIAELADSDFSRFDLRTLRTGIMAGAPCPIELMKDVVHKMGVNEMTICYGLTEASPMTHQTRTTDSLEKRVNTVGRPVPHMEAKIVDPTDFNELGTNEVGEIWVKGYNVMLGYYHRPEETDAAIVCGGWLRTGDLGVKDENGYYKIVGRLKEMLIVGGHNVYPAEVEQALLSIFEEEMEAIQIIGVPHRTLQEVTAAVVKLKPGKSLTAARIKDKCKTRLEWPKIPKYVKFVSDFNEYLTVTGKIQKRKLREALIKELGLEDLVKIKTA